MGEHSNMPDATGESVDTWQLRKQAWQHGHDAQSGAIDARQADSDGADDAAAGRRTHARSDDLAAMAEDIRKARETLSALHDEIAWVRSDEGLRSLAALAQENKRLQDELRARSD